MIKQLVIIESVIEKLVKRVTVEVTDKEIVIRYKRYKEGE